MSRPRRTLLLLAVALCALPAAPASAANPVISDCSAHNSLLGHYSVTQLRNALNTLPADIKEYTDCYDVIDRQLLTQMGRLHGNGSGGGGGGSFLPLPLIIVLVLLLLAGGALAVRAAVHRRGHPADPEADTSVVPPAEPGAPAPPAEPGAPAPPAEPGAPAPPPADPPARGT